MLPTRQGSIRLFRFAGIDVYLHWSWLLLLIAAYGIRARLNDSSVLPWPFLDYLSLFAIVLMHEFGHALACRQVGGRASQIMLWPFGGVAYVSPPPRPGATLWSIAAGPLVNVALAPIFTGLTFLAYNSGWPQTMPNAYVFLRTICLINFLLLFFNLLPIYPLDGGQILQSLLWFVLGRSRSLLVASLIGFIGVAGLFVVALVVWSKGYTFHASWIFAISVIILLNCWGGLRHARLLARVAKLPRRSGFACPSCRQPPIRGILWRCSTCFEPFDTFETGAVCPHCGTQFPVTQCLDCGASRPIAEWVQPPPIPVDSRLA